MHKNQFDTLPSYSTAKNFGGRVIPFKTDPAMGNPHLGVECTTRGWRYFSRESSRPYRMGYTTRIFTDPALPRNRLLSFMTHINDRKDELATISQPILALRDKYTLHHSNLSHLLRCTSMDTATFYSAPSRMRLGTKASDGVVTDVLESALDSTFSDQVASEIVLRSSLSDISIYSPGGIHRILDLVYNINLFSLTIWYPQVSHNPNALSSFYLLSNLDPGLLVCSMTSSRSFSYGHVSSHPFTFETANNPTPCSVSHFQECAFHNQYRVAVKSCWMCRTVGDPNLLDPLTTEWIDSTDRGSGSIVPICEHIEQPIITYASMTTKSHYSVTYSISPFNYSVRGFEKNLLRLENGASAPFFPVEFHYNPTENNYVPALAVKIIGEKFFFTFKHDTVSSPITVVVGEVNMCHVVAPAHTVFVRSPTDTNPNPVHLFLNDGQNRRYDTHKTYQDVTCVYATSKYVFPASKVLSLFDDKSDIVNNVSPQIEHYYSHLIYQGRFSASDLVKYHMYVSFVNGSEAPAGEYETFATQQIQRIQFEMIVVFGIGTNLNFGRFTYYPEPTLTNEKTAYELRLSSTNLPHSDTLQDQLVPLRYHNYHDISNFSKYHFYRHLAQATGPLTATDLSFTIAQNVQVRQNILDDKAQRMNMLPNYLFQGSRSFLPTVTQNLFISSEDTTPYIRSFALYYGVGLLSNIEISPTLLPNTLPTTTPSQKELQLFPFLTSSSKVALLSSVKPGDMTVGVDDSYSINFNISHDSFPSPFLDSLDKGMNSEIKRLTEITARFVRYQSGSSTTDCQFQAQEYSMLGNTAIVSVTLQSLRQCTASDPSENRSQGFYITLGLQLSPTPDVLTDVAVIHSQPVLYLYHRLTLDDDDDDGDDDDEEEPPILPPIVPIQAVISSKSRYEFDVNRVPASSYEKYIQSPSKPSRVCLNCSDPVQAPTFYPSFSFYHYSGNEVPYPEYKFIRAADTDRVIQWTASAVCVLPDTTTSTIATVPLQILTPQPDGPAHEEKFPASRIANEFYISMQDLNVESCTVTLRLKITSGPSLEDEMFTLIIIQKTDYDIIVLDFISPFLGVGAPTPPPSNVIEKASVMFSSQSSARQAISSHASLIADDIITHTTLPYRSTSVSPTAMTVVVTQPTSSSTTPSNRFIISTEVETSSSLKATSVRLHPKFRTQADEVYFRDRWVFPASLDLTRTLLPFSTKFSIEFLAKQQLPSPNGVPLQPLDILLALEFTFDSIDDHPDFHMGKIDFINLLLAGPPRPVASLVSIAPQYISGRVGADDQSAFFSPLLGHSEVVLKIVDEAQAQLKTIASSPWFVDTWEKNLEIFAESTVSISKFAPTKGGVPFTPSLALSLQKVFLRRVSSGVNIRLLVDLCRPANFFLEVANPMGISFTKLYSLSVDHLTNSTMSPLSPEDAALVSDLCALETALQPKSALEQATDIMDRLDALPPVSSLPACEQDDIKVIPAPLHEMLVLAYTVKERVSDYITTTWPLGPPNPGDTVPFDAVHGLMNRFSAFVTTLEGDLCYNAVIATEELSPIFLLYDAVLGTRPIFSINISPSRLVSSVVPFLRSWTLQHSIFQTKAARIPALRTYKHSMSKFAASLGVNDRAPLDIVQSNLQTMDNVVRFFSRDIIQQTEAEVESGEIDGLALAVLRSEMEAESREVIQLTQDIVNSLSKVVFIGTGLGTSSPDAIVISDQGLETFLHQSDLLELRYTKIPYKTTSETTISGLQRKRQDQGQEQGQGQSSQLQDTTQVSSYGNMQIPPFVAEFASRKFDAVSSYYVMKDRKLAESALALSLDADSRMSSIVSLSIINGLTGNVINVNNVNPGSGQTQWFFIEIPIIESSGSNSSGGVQEMPNLASRCLHSNELTTTTTSGNHWKDDTTCQLHSVTTHSVTCRCTHLTFFSTKLSINSLIPKFQSITMDNLRLISWENLTRNIVPLIILFVWPILTLLFVGFAQWIDYRLYLQGFRKLLADWDPSTQFPYGKDDVYKVKSTDSLFYILWRRYCYAIRDTHIWFSVFFRQTTHNYSSKARAFAGMVLLLSSFTLSGVFFGYTQQGFIVIILLTSVCLFFISELLRVVFDHSEKDKLKRFVYYYAESLVYFYYTGKSLLFPVSDHEEMMKNRPASLIENGAAQLGDLVLELGWEMVPMGAVHAHQNPDVPSQEKRTKFDKAIVRQYAYGDVDTFYYRARKYVTQLPKVEAQKVHQTIRRRLPSSVLTAENMISKFYSQPLSDSIPTVWGFAGALIILLWILACYFLILTNSVILAVRGEDTITSSTIRDWVTTAGTSILIDLFVSSFILGMVKSTFLYFFRYIRLQCCGRDMSANSGETGSSTSAVVKIEALPAIKTFRRLSYLGVKDENIEMTDFVCKEGMFTDSPSLASSPKSGAMLHIADEVELEEDETMVGDNNENGLVFSVQVRKKNFPTTTRNL